MLIAIVTLVSFVMGIITALTFRQFWETRAIAQKSSSTDKTITKTAGKGGLKALTTKTEDSSKEKFTPIYNSYDLLKSIDDWVDLYDTRNSDFSSHLRRITDACDGIMKNRSADEISHSVVLTKVRAIQEGYLPKIVRIYNQSVKTQNSDLIPTEQARSIWEWIEGDEVKDFLHKDTDLAGITDDIRNNLNFKEPDMLMKSQENSERKWRNYSNA